MPDSSSRFNLKRESILVISLLLAGLTLLPLAIWLVGSSVFGAYAGDGFAGFYGQLAGRLAAGGVVAWFLVLSPLLGVAVLRLTLSAFRAAGR